MQKNFLDGEIVVVAVYLEEPEDGQPSGELLDLSLFLTTEDGVTQLDRMVKEPYIIDWIHSKTMCIADVLGRRLIYEADDGMSCDIEKDTLPVEAPEAVHAMLGGLRAGGAGSAAGRRRQTRPPA